MNKYLDESNLLAKMLENLKTLEIYKSALKYTVIVEYKPKDFSNILENKFIKLVCNCFKSVATLRFDESYVHFGFSNAEG